MTDEELIDELLYRGEGPALDFKMKQYPHDGAHEEEKGELLKDVLAFSNSWRNELAYIVVGVSDDLQIVGLDKDLDDSRLQQFINGKTNAPVHFLYRSVKYRGVLLGLYTIQVQERPIFAKQKYGKVQPDVVYVRRGSSTTIAKPDEIAKMGASVQGETGRPDLKVRAVSSEGLLLDCLSMEYKNFNIESIEDWPDYNVSGVFYAGLNKVNRNYYRDYGAHIQQNSGLLKFRFQVENLGDHYADDVKIIFEVPVKGDMDVVDEDGLLEIPSCELPLIRPVNLKRLNPALQRIKIHRRVDGKDVLLVVGKIHAGESVVTDFVYIVRPSADARSIRLKVLADQFKTPFVLEIPLEISEIAADLDFETLGSFLR